MECPPFCQCDYHTSETAFRHAQGDAACGRSWVCACGTCKRTRETPSILALFDVHEKFDKVLRLEKNLDRVEAIIRDLRKEVK